MSLLDEARNAPTWRRHPDTPEFASVPAEARDALVELADAAADAEFGIELDDPGLDYLTGQVDRRAHLRLLAALVRLQR